MDTTCTACDEHITLIGGEWTTDDGTIACYADLSAPFVPHKPAAEVA
jgi:hypothetical protein